MTPALEVYAPGTPVEVGPKDSPLMGRITGVWIGDSYTVQYRVVWWDNRSRQEEWLNASEVAPTASTRLPVSFYLQKGL